MIMQRLSYNVAPNPMGIADLAEFCELTALRKLELEIHLPEDCVVEFSSKFSGQNILYAL